MKAETIANYKNPIEHLNCPYPILVGLVDALTTARWWKWWKVGLRKPSRIRGALVPQDGKLATSAEGEMMEGCLFEDPSSPFVEMLLNHMVAIEYPGKVPLLINAAYLAQFFVASHDVGFSEISRLTQLVDAGTTPQPDPATC